MPHIGNKLLMIFSLQKATTIPLYVEMVSVFGQENEGTKGTSAEYKRIDLLLFFIPEKVRCPGIVLRLLAPPRTMALPWRVRLQKPIPPESTLQVQQMGFSPRRPIFSVINGGIICLPLK